MKKLKTTTNGHETVESAINALLPRFTDEDGVTYSRMCIGKTFRMDGEKVCMTAQMMYRLYVPSDGNMLKPTGTKIEAPSRDMGCRSSVLVSRSVIDDKRKAGICQVFLPDWANTLDEFSFDKS